MRIFARRKRNRFVALIQDACRFDKEAAGIAEEFLSRGRIAELIDVETATKLAGHHEALSNMYKVAAREDLFCDCCHEKAARENTAVHLKDKQPATTH